MSNDTQTMTLVDFLLARIAEGAKWVHAVGADAVGHADGCIYEGGFEGTRECDCGAVDRALADLLAKRRIVEDAQIVRDADGENPRLAPPAARTLRHLAAVYADHPDYRDEWRA